jgi:hypothetical protein
VAFGHRSKHSAADEGLKAGRFIPAIVPGASGTGRMTLCKGSKDRY